MTAKKKRKLASLSLDLDNQWSYMKTHGDEGWKGFPSYLDWSVPRILEFLEERDLKITFFIVGQDATVEQNKPALRAIGDAGHEIGNHSFNHDPWLHLYTEEQLDQELQQAEEAIEGATGKAPVGFRYFFATSSLSKEEKEQRKGLFGTWRDALRPVSPFNWRIDDKQLFELPVTTMPLFKTPIHLSYILYASRYSRFLAMAYFRFALLMCRITRVAPSILLHPLDFIGCDDVDELAFFPGMDMPAAEKMEIVARVIDEMKKHYELVTMEEHVNASGSDLRTLDLQTTAS